MFDTWINEPKSFTKSDTVISITAGKEMDSFNDPVSGAKKDKAPIYACRIDGDFTISCKVEPNFNTTYDAGSIMLYINENNWIKFAFEYTDIGHNAAVAVVTDEYSDDANGEMITQKYIWMQMSRKKDCIGLHFSLDGINWRMMRLFKHNFSKSDIVYVGLSAQSPMGDECEVVFDNINITKKSIDNMRTGV